MTAGRNSIVGINLKLPTLRLRKVYMAKDPISYLYSMISAVIPSPQDRQKWAKEPRCSSSQTFTALECFSKGSHTFRTPTWGSQNAGALFTLSIVIVVRYSNRVQSYPSFGVLTRRICIWTFGTILGTNMTAVLHVTDISLYVLDFPEALRRGRISISMLPRHN